MKELNVKKFMKKEYISYVLFAFLFIWCFVLCFKVRTAGLKADQAKYLYVYNADLLAKNYPELANLQNNYQSQIASLSSQLEEIKAKVEKVSDPKAKEEVSKAYFSQIAEKRNNLVSGYQKSLQVLDAKVNRALEAVAIEKGAPAVFSSTALTVRTPYVIDITGDVLQKLK